LDGIDADGRLSLKTCFDYRHYTDKYVRPLLGNRKARDVTPEVIPAWQRKVRKAGGVKHGQALAPNTVRLARSPLSGAMKLAVSMGLIAVSPTAPYLGLDPLGPFPDTGRRSRCGSSGTHGG
jgi:hypothetical protein